jgi:hypothetical protein
VWHEDKDGDGSTGYENQNSSKQGWLNQWNTIL